MKIDAAFINKEKQKAITLGLEAEFVLVHLNPHAPGVKVPSFLLDRPSVTLKLSYFFKRVLHVTPEKVTAELLFGDTYHTCIVPYEAIWGVAREGEGLMVWPASVPPEVAQILGAAAAAATTSEVPEKPEVSLKVVESPPIVESKPNKKAPRKKKASVATATSSKEVVAPKKKNTKSARASVTKKTERPKLVRVK